MESAVKHGDSCRRQLAPLAAPHIINPMSASTSLPAPRPQPLASLLADVSVLDLSGDARRPIAYQTCDSRLVQPGSLFVAYRGVSEDSHRFLADAARRGATACLVEQDPARLRTEQALPPDLALVRVADARLARGLVAAALYDHPSRAMAVVGVTGTDGKTTTSSLLHAILVGAGRRAGLVSTVGARIGADLLDTGLHATTPEPEALQALLALMRDRGMDHAVVETSSHGLAQHRVAGIAYDVAVLTNLTREHLDYHQDLDGYREAKGMLFHALSRGPRKPGLPPTSVINADDPSAAWFSAIPAERRLSYGLEGQGDFRLLARLESRGALSRFTAATPGGEVEVEIPLAGDYNIANSLAAMAAAYALGVAPPEAVGPLARFGGVPGRLETIHEGQPFAALVDFAHTPNALAQVLTAARRMTGSDGRVIVAFGCAGLRDVPKRADMGRVAGRLADLILVTAEDPRTEDLDAIIAESARGLVEVGRREGRDFWRHRDRYQAVLHACALAEAGDVLLLCGKGHEQSMCFGDEEYAWDDRLALRAALRGERYGLLPTTQLPAADTPRP